MGLLQVTFPEIGESADGGAVDNPVIGRPADVQSVYGNDLSVWGIPRQFPDSPESSNANFWLNQYWKRIGAADLWSFGRDHFRFRNLASSENEHCECVMLYERAFRV